MIALKKWKAIYNKRFQSGYKSHVQADKSSWASVTQVHRCSRFLSVRVDGDFLWLNLISGESGALLYAL